MDKIEGLWTLRRWNTFVGKDIKGRWGLSEDLLYTEYCDLPVAFGNNLALEEKPNDKNIKEIPKWNGLGEIQG